jgi:chemotaxis protein CheC
MNDIRCAESLRLDILRRLFASATHDASAAMCRWTDGLINLTLDEVREIPLDTAANRLNLSDNLLTMVVLVLPGEIGGTMILIFDEHSGRQLAASLLRKPPDETSTWSELEISALKETGNILGCAYIGALTRLIDRPLVPSAPYFIQDYGASVFQQALSPRAMLGDRVLVCRTGFHKQGEKLDWHVIFMPTDGMCRTLEESLHCSR